jgi:hypothetical protein
MIVTAKDGKSVNLDTAIARAIEDAYFDADGAVFFQRELEFIKARSYDVQYAELKARMIFPVSNEAGPGINSITYRTYDQVGAAKIIQAYADDLPRADVAGKETSIPVRSIGISYGYSIDEIQASQLTGMGLDQRRANAFFGDAESGLPGFFNNANIPSGNVVNPGGGTAWASKTPDQILFDINDAFADVFELTKMVESANTLLLPPAQWSYISATPRSANSDTTILQYIVQNSPYLTSAENVIPINECTAALNPEITNDAMVVYNRSPDKLELEIPVELEYMPIQQKNLEFIVPGRTRIGGVNVYYPLSVSILEGI